MGKRTMYQCGCDCKKRGFATLKEAREHVKEKHSGEIAIYYLPPYGEKIKVDRKG